MENIYGFLENSKIVYKPDANAPKLTVEDIIQTAKRIKPLRHIGLILMTKDGTVVEGYDLILACALRERNSKYKMDGYTSENWEKLYEIVKDMPDKLVSVDYVPDDFLAKPEGWSIKTWWDDSEFGKLKAEWLKNLVYNMWHAYYNHSISWDKLQANLHALWSYEVRRQIVGTTFPSFKGYNVSDNLYNFMFKHELWITLRQVVQTLNQASIYTRNRVLTKYLLSHLEKMHNPCLNTDEHTIEHIMPRTWCSEWKETPETVHKGVVNLLGNLTLTRYNIELGQKRFSEKKEILDMEYLFLNKSVLCEEKWNKQTIEARTQMLVMEMQELLWVSGEKKYKDTKSENIYTVSTLTEIKESKPDTMKLFGITENVKTWRETLVRELDAIHINKPIGFAKIVDTYPQYFSADKEDLKAPAQLNTGIFVETQRSKPAILVMLQKFATVAECEENDVALRAS